MKLVSLRYGYKNKDGKNMIFVCRVTMAPRMTLAIVKQDIRARLESEVGPIDDLTLLAQNDPYDVMMLNAQE